MLIKIMTCGLLLFADPWGAHQEQIQLIERDMYRLEKELEVLVEKKKLSLGQARIQASLDRIVEIHAELIGLRKQMDNQKDHLEKEHPDKAEVLKHYDARLIRAQMNRKGSSRTELSQHLDQLLMKVKMKYSHFSGQDKSSEDLEEMAQIISQKREKKRDRDAQTYLRERSEVQLSK